MMKACLIFIFLFIKSCTQPDSKPHQKLSLVIKPLYPYVETVHVNNGYKVRLYAMESFKNYDEDSVALDQFVAEHIDADYKNHFNYSIQFFERKANSQPNEVSQKGEAHAFDYKNPVIAYNWSKGIFRGVSYSKKDLYWIYYKNKEGVFYSLDSSASREPVKIGGEDTASDKPEIK